MSLAPTTTVIPDLIRDPERQGAALAALDPSLRWDDDLRNIKGAKM